MLFNSIEFFLFFPVVLVLYFLLPLSGRTWLLLAASLYFYMQWEPVYVVLLLVVCLVNFYAGRRICRSRADGQRRGWLVAALCVNLGILCAFKYYNFFLDTLGMMGAAPSFLPQSRLLLPLGVSFYTFHSLTYTIDVYRRKIPEELSLPDFALFVTFFPQLVAGPIVRAADMLPQYKVLHRFEWDNIVTGGQRVLTGFIKKTVIADNLCLIVNPVYNSPAEHSWLMLLIATYAFAFQIVCDFGGYSDMAIGLAKMMGIRLMENFETPYISRSIQEFWRRWHISLSTWLRDYLYISLGGNRHGAWKTYRNLIVTMLLGGLWHGASFNFVIWGGIHGVWLAAERLWTRGVTEAKGGTATKEHGLFSIVGILKMVFVFHGVCLAWVFFRAPTLSAALSVIGRILSGAEGVQLGVYNVFNAFMILGLGGFYCLLAELGDRRSRRVWWMTSIFGILLITLFGRSSNEFIYFVF
jgi:D-alanyl-lipoteichoic acid acyltransferase DltB (MBOAT superfamily)